MSQQNQLRGKENKKGEKVDDEDFLAFDTENDEITQHSDDDMDTSRDEETDDDLPPWMLRHPDPKRTHLLTSLHNEIVSFCQLIEPLPEEITAREQLVKRIEKLVKQIFANGEIDVFGSQATGLFLPTSDIDIVILTNEEKCNENKPDKQEDWDQPATSALHRFSHMLREEWFSELTYLEVLENTRVPLVKFTHGPTNISVDVCFDQPSGPPAAKLMKTYLEALPPLRPLTFVLKYFLVARGLNEPYSGGVGSYLLQLMIVAFLQQRERDAYNYRRVSHNNLGVLLIEFFSFYGLDFNYATAGISVRHDGYFFPKGAADKKETFYQALKPFMLAFENPLDPTTDVGTSSFRIQMVQRAFVLAYRQLMAHTTTPANPTVSILATILPPTEAMVDRRELKRRLRLKRKKQFSDVS